MKSWRILLGVYLLLCGLYWVVPQISFPWQGILMGVLAIIAAVLILMDR
jgi:hypothetical protein